MMSLTAVVITALANPANYRFVERTDRHVAMITEERFKLGRLTRDGKFVVTRDLPHGAYSGPLFAILPAGNLRPQRMYELRDQVIVPGWMFEGVFTPDTRPRSIRFVDYKYTPWSVPIWNLPGFFEFVFARSDPIVAK